MIDRDARNRLLQGIDNYMDERMSAAEFDDLLHNKIAQKTKDEVIKEISFWLFESYDDIGTNRLQSNCHYWKFYNRLRLLLTSEAECRFERQPQQRLLPYQAIGILSILSLIALAVVSFCLQSWAVLLIYGIPLYVLCGAAVFVSLFFGKPAKPDQSFLFAQYPFESFADLLALRRSVPDFSSKRFPNKPPFPAPSRNRLIRFLWDTKCPAWVDHLGDAFISSFLVFYGFLWLIVLWPLLVVLSFPLRNAHQTRFVIPGESQDRSLHSH